MRIPRHQARVDVAFSDPAVRAADADVLVASAETALDVALEVRQYEQRVIVQHTLADMHFLEPLAALDRQRSRTVRVGDVHRAEGPAVDLQGLAVVLGRIAAALVIGVGFDDRRLRKAGGEQLLHPGAREDVRALGLAGVQLHGHLAAEDGGDAVVDLLQTLLREVACKEYHGALPRAFVIGDVVVAVPAGNGLVISHVFSSSKRLDSVFPFIPARVGPKAPSGRRYRSDGKAFPDTIRRARNMRFCPAAYRRSGGGAARSGCQIFTSS